MVTYSLPVKSYISLSGFTILQLLPVGQIYFSTSPYSYSTVEVNLTVENEVFCPCGVGIVPWAGVFDGKAASVREQVTAVKQIYMSCMYISL